ncbi:nuclear transport factor 2 family protein [Frankia sp. CNm7]|nr:nuclear transport factor 2 family protein [Frankia nepalensis]MBL7509062.1 nuclear transport factor 2 family protein [Frankia nepalensis]MBL7516835.1 nuclear transport factor 2 family protein [Frankia nepalensis]
MSAFPVIAPPCVERHRGFRSIFWIPVFVPGRGSDLRPGCDGPRCLERMDRGQMRSAGVGGLLPSSLFRPFREDALMADAERAAARTRRLRRMNGASTMAGWRLVPALAVAALALLTSGSALAGCATGDDAPPLVSATATDPDPEAAREERVAVDTRGFLDAFERRDLDWISGLLAPDVTLVQPMSFDGSQQPAIRFAGKEQVVGYFRQVFAGMGTISFVDRRITVAAGGDTVIVQANGNFTTAAGSPYRNVYLFRFDWRDGRIAAGEEYANPITAARVLGLPIG